MNLCLSLFAVLLTSGTQFQTANSDFKVRDRIALFRQLLSERKFDTAYQMKAELSAILGRNVPASMKMEINELLGRLEIHFENYDEASLNFRKAASSSSDLYLKARFQFQQGRLDLLTAGSSAARKSALNKVIGSYPNLLRRGFVEDLEARSLIIETLIEAQEFDLAVKWAAIQENEATSAISKNTLAFADAKSSRNHLFLAKQSFGEASIGLRDFVSAKKALEDVSKIQTTLPKIVVAKSRYLYGISLELTGEPVKAEASYEVAMQDLASSPTDFGSLSLLRASCLRSTNAIDTAEKSKRILEQALPGLAYSEPVKAQLFSELVLNARIRNDDDDEKVFLRKLDAIAKANARLYAICIGAEFSNQAGEDYVAYREARGYAELFKRLHETGYESVHTFLHDRPVGDKGVKIRDSFLRVEERAERNDTVVITFSGSQSADNRFLMQPERDRGGVLSLTELRAFVERINADQVVLILEGINAESAQIFMSQFLQLRSKSGGRVLLIGGPEPEKVEVGEFGRLYVQVSSLFKKALESNVDCLDAGKLVQSVLRPSDQPQVHTVSLGDQVTIPLIKSARVRDTEIDTLFAAESQGQITAPPFEFVPGELSRVGDDYAIVVGNNEFGEWGEDLINAVSDSQKLAKKLCDKFNFKKVIVLNDVTKSKFIDAVSHIADEVGFRQQNAPYKDNQIFIFVASHGAVDPKDNSRIFVRDSYIVFNGTKKEDFEYEGLDIGALATMLSRLDAGHIGVFLDLCYSAGFNALAFSRIGQGKNSNESEPILKDAGRFVLGTAVYKVSDNSKFLPPFLCYLDKPPGKKSDERYGKTFLKFFPDEFIKSSGESWDHRWFGEAFANKAAFYFFPKLMVPAEPVPPATQLNGIGARRTRVDRD